MELLQAVQYYFIADSLDSPICAETINKILTLLGYLHICMQPYFCHVINCSLTQNPTYRDRYIVVKRFESLEPIQRFVESTQIYDKFEIESVALTARDAPILQALHDWGRYAVSEIFSGLDPRLEYPGLFRELPSQHGMAARPQIVYFQNGLHVAFGLVRKYLF